MSTIHKLYLLEGMEEHAIDSLALELKDSIEQTGRKVILYTKGMLHPADMAHQAYLSMEEYKEFLQDALEIWKIDRIGSKDELTDLITSQTCIEHGHAIIAHQMLHFPSTAYDSLLSDLSAREIYDGKLPYDTFLELHLLRWKQFCKQALNTPNTTYLFTNTLFKNHITELMGFYDMDEERIISHLTLLLSQVLSLNPSLMYLHTDSIDSYLTTLTTEMTRDLKLQVEQSNFGRLRGLKGLSGITYFLENRRQIEEHSLQSFSDTLPEYSIEYREICH